MNKSFENSYCVFQSERLDRKFALGIQEETKDLGALGYEVRFPFPSIM